VPVGEDQAPIIEQIKEIVRRINRQAGRDLLPEARALIPLMGRLPGVVGEAKMSKSQGNAIPLSASDAEITDAVQRMYTDPVTCGLATQDASRGMLCLPISISSTTTTMPSQS
jgi:tryptophanyl-tRNA synthetase